MGKTVKMSFEGKSQQEPRNWQMDRILIILKKENGPRASSATALGLNNVAISESNPMVLQKYALVLWLYLSFSVENESRNLIFDQFPVC